MNWTAPGFLVAGAVLLAMSGVSALPAQLVSSLDAGVASVRFRTIPRATAFVLTPAVRLERPHSMLLATGTLALFEGGHASGQGELAASVFAPLAGRLFGEVTMVANGGSYRSTHAGQLLGQIRLRLVGDAMGVWLGAGAGRARHTAAWHTVTVADGGVWATIGDATVTASLATTTFPLALGDSTSGPPVLRSLQPPDERRDRFLDATTSLSWPLLRSVDLDLSLGARGGTRVSNDEAWGRVGATVWLSQRLALVGGVGRYARDPSQDLEASEYATVALRIGSRSPRRHAKPYASSPATGLVLKANGSGSRTIRIRVPGARRVELMGDFTDWRVVTLSRVNDEVWAVTLPLVPGTYRVSVRADSGTWRAPLGLPAFTDDFNGEVGVLVVE